jgi:hypothetical protein
MVLSHSWWRDTIVCATYRSCSVHGMVCTPATLSYTNTMMKITLSSSLGGDDAGLEARLKAVRQLDSSNRLASSLTSYESSL